MNPLQPLYILAEKGLQKNKKPFLILNGAFSSLENAYLWRDSVKKREGLKLVGRLRRLLTAQAAGNVAINATSTTTFNLFAQLGITGEDNAEIVQGNIQNITLTFGAPFSTVLSDTTGTGILTGFGAPINGATINYSTGVVSIINGGGAFAASPLTVTMAYYPNLPVMGIDQRELAAINLEETVFFDTKYVYNYNDGLSLFINPSTTTWSGGDANFFWMANYRGSDANQRLFFVTNFTDPTVSTNNRIRYTENLNTWVDHTPAIAGTNQRNESPAIAVSTVNNFSGTLANTPIIPGSVTITASNPGDATISFKDRITTYPNGELIGAPPSNTGTINYTTGAITLTYSTAFTAVPDVLANYQNESAWIYQCKLIIPYYGRLLYLNTWEGNNPPNNAAGSTNFFNRCRFSQIGNPIERQAWVSTIFGKGGFIDAPTNEAIVSARFFKNTLIVFFEKTTWQIRYVGDYGLPFIWERISSDFGSESKLSTVLFDEGVLAVGDKAIVKTSGNDVSRIDLDVPDTVFNFHNQEEGKERVHGTRDFQKEVVFWNYSDGGLERKFPNRILLYNYRNDTWAIFRDNITAFGLLTNASGTSWDSETSWDSNTSWDILNPGEYPTVISGNQHGFIHYFQYYFDIDTAQPSKILQFLESESMYIRGITRSTTSNLQLNIPNHNLESGDIIFITGMQFVDETTIPPSTLPTSLNDRFYRVLPLSPEDPDVVQVVVWSDELNGYIDTNSVIFPYTPLPGTGEYKGGGVAALYPKMNIRTKDFNPYEEKGIQFKSSYVDFQTDGTPNASITVQPFVNSIVNPNLVANLPIWNPNVETALSQIGNVTGATNDNPCVITSPNHSLQTGRQIQFSHVGGMSQINGNIYTVTFVTLNTFSINADATLFGVYTFGGVWQTIDQNNFYNDASVYAWHRFYATVFGQYISFQLTYDDSLMNNPVTHQSDFQMNAIRLWVKPGGRMVL